MPVSRTPTSTNQNVESTSANPNADAGSGPTPNPTEEANASNADQGTATGLTPNLTEEAITKDTADQNAELSNQSIDKTGGDSDTDTDADTPADEAPNSNNRDWMGICADLQHDKEQLQLDCVKLQLGMNDLRLDRDTLKLEVGKLQSQVEQLLSNHHPLGNQNAYHHSRRKSSDDWQSFSRTEADDLEQPTTRRSTIVTDSVQHLVAGIQQYEIKTYKGDPITMTETLLPKNNITIDDLMVRTVLGNLQQGKHIIPAVFKEISLSTQLYKDAEICKGLSKQYKTAIHSIITEFWHHHDSLLFLDRTTMAECIQASFNLGITNPLMVGRVIIETVRDHPNTSRLWNMIKNQHSQHNIILTTHVLDLYETSCTQRQTLDPIDQYTKPFFKACQGNRSAFSYVQDKCQKLKALLDRYDHSAGPQDLRGNSTIQAAIKDMITHVHNKSTGVFKEAMQQDKIATLGTSELDWTGTHESSFGGLSQYFHKTKLALDHFASKHDRLVALMAASNTRPDSGYNNNNNTSSEVNFGNDTSNATIGRDNQGRLKPTPVQITRPKPNGENHRPAGTTFETNRQSRHSSQDPQGVPPLQRHPRKDQGQERTRRRVGGPSLMGTNVVESDQKSAPVDRTAGPP